MTAEQYAEQVKIELADTWLPQIYIERILKMRTRLYTFGAFSRKRQVQIQHTLLGVELKVGSRRLLCPDLATARYLSVFARVGCPEVAIPYDITKVSLLADELESSWHRMLLLSDDKAAERTQALRARIRGLLIAKISGEISAAGAGTPVPEFKQSTQRARGGS